MTEYVDRVIRDGEGAALRWLDAASPPAREEEPGPEPEPELEAADGP